NGYGLAGGPALAVAGATLTAESLAPAAPVVKTSGKRKKTETEPAAPVVEEIALAPATVSAAESDEAGEDDEYEYEDDSAEEEYEEEETAPEPIAPAPLKVNASSKAAAPKAAKIDPAKAERQVVMQQLDAAAKELKDATDYELPSIELLAEAEEVPHDEHDADVRRKAKLLEQTFQSFGLNVRVVEIDTGPVIAQFEVELEAGLRLNKVTALADDLAIALRVPSVRIVAPIPGKNTVGVEIPNAKRRLVRMREVIEESTEQVRKQRIPIFLGEDVSGHPLTCDLTTMPHLLIAGRTGTGKSVCLNTLICSILMTRRPDEVKMLLIDPKMVELSCYKKIPHLMHPVVTDMKKAEAILGWAVEKMEERYALLARAGVRHIGTYNQLGKAELLKRLQPEDDQQAADIPETLPYIIVVADEFADLIMTSPKEVETHIIRLAQKSRAVGIHLILATQKPTVDVITGLIKSNLPARIAFQVASRTDSRVVLDEMGADKLLGYGDMLFLQPGTSTMMRGQCTYISDDEINSICEAVETAEPQFAPELVTLKPKEDPDAPASSRRRDTLFEAAVDVVVREGRGSVSLLQRCLGIGYGRAARIIDEMAEDGIVGSYNGAQAREVLFTVEEWEARQARTKAAAGGAAKAPAIEASAPLKSAKPSVKLAPVVEAEEEEDLEGEYEDDEEGDDEDYGDDDDGDSPQGGRRSLERV
ncbi:MAG TPA: DNA translocase FtsK, partial [Pirellulales bacterium]